MVKIPDFIKNQWKDIKGNAKWDFIKLGAIAVIAVPAAIIKFIGHAPLWEVLIVLAATTGCVSFFFCVVFWALQKFKVGKNAPKADAMAPKIEEQILVEGKNPNKIDDKFTNGRVIVDVPPIDLIRIYHTHTTIQADALINVYLGKWMIYEGFFHDVHKCGDGTFLVTFKDPSKKQFWEALSWENIYANFRSGDTVTILQRGKKIKVIGKIRKVDFASLALDDCELI